MRISFQDHKHNAPQVAMQGPTIRDQPQELIIYLVYQMILSRIWTYTQSYSWRFSRVTTLTGPREREPRTFPVETPVKILHCTHSLVDSFLRAFRILKLQCVLTWASYLRPWVSFSKTIFHLHLIASLGPMHMQS